MGWMRSRALGVLMGVVAGSVLLTGCGSSEIPDDASAKDFCSAGDRFSTATEFKDGVKAAEGLRETGTPKDISADARKGFVLVVELVAESSDTKDLQKRYEDLTDKEKQSVDSLDTYIRKTCTG